MLRWHRAPVWLSFPPPGARALAPPLLLRRDRWHAGHRHLPAPWRSQATEPFLPARAVHVTRDRRHCLGRPGGNAARPANGQSKMSRPGASGQPVGVLPVRSSRRFRTVRPNPRPVTGRLDRSRPLPRSSGRRRHVRAIRAEMTAANSGPLSASRNAALSSAIRPSTVGSLERRRVFDAREASGGCPATCDAAARAASRTGLTAAFAKPHSAASEPVRCRPVKMSSAARRSPTTRGRSKLEAASGTRPSSTNGAESSAVGST